MWAVLAIDFRQFPLQYAMRLRAPIPMEHSRTFVPPFRIPITNDIVLSAYIGGLRMLQRYVIRLATKQIGIISYR